MPAIYVRADTGSDSNAGTEAAPKQTFAAGLAALKAASGSGDKVLYLYQNSAETLGYNIAATQSVTDTHDVAGGAFRFEAYGPGRWAWLQAVQAVTGWTDDGPGRAKATVSGTFRTVWWGPKVKRLKRATKGEEQTTANRALYRVQEWYDGFIFASGGTFSSAETRNVIFSQYTLVFSGTGTVTVAQTGFPNQVFTGTGSGVSRHRFFAQAPGAATFTPSGTVSACTLQPWRGVFFFGGGPMTGPTSTAVNAVTYDLRFSGTGSITLTGAATGTFNGTGSGESTHTFTPSSAGTITLTPSGTVNGANLQGVASIVTPADVWTFDVPSASLPAGGATEGLEICVQEGWSLSKMRVDSINDFGNGRARVYVKDPERTVEFAKSDLLFPGLGSAFSLGPYHQDPVEFPFLENGAPNPGQRFWWESAEEFLTRPGDWHHDPDTNTLRIQLPTGIANAAALEAAGVWVTNGCERLLSLNGAGVTSRVTGVSFKRVGFRGVDWTWPSSNGYIGYLGRGVALRNGGGFVAFQELETCVYMANSQAVGFEDCVWRDLGATGVYAIYANSNLSFRKCLMTRTGGPAIAGGGTAGIQVALSPQDYTDNIAVYNCIIKDAGEDYPTAGASMGALRAFEFRRNTIDGTTSNGLDYNTGGKWYGSWEQDVVVEGNDIKRFMKWTQDTGGLYTSGNMSGFTNIGTKPLDPSQTRGNRIVANWIGDCIIHDNDPFGGKQPCVYLDIGQQNALVTGNRFYNTPLAMKENCVGYNLWAYNHVSNCNELSRVFFSGFNAWTPFGPMAQAFIQSFAVPYTLSFVGTGTVTLTGTSTAGPLVGTGVADRVSLTFTPTAGVLGLTPSGDVRACTLSATGVLYELGSFINYQPPLSNPPTADDNAKFYGTGIYTGRGFQSILPVFTTPEAVVKPNGQYNSASTFISNDALQPKPDQSTVGALPETFDHFADELE